jgi:hypothetical protein
MAVLPAFGQSPTSKYQPGTITAVKTHEDKTAGAPSATRFDISLRVKNTVYVVLYTPPPGTYGTKYTQGMSLLVLVGSKTITFSDMSGVSREVPILSRTTVPKSNH